jgi:hypothetical protein
MTPSCSSARRANSSDGSPFGTGIQRYIVALGGGDVEAAPRKAATIASRRRWKVATLPGTHSSQPSSAATPAAWMPRYCPVSTNVFTFASAPTISGLPTAQPRRHPVMLYVFESEWNSIATSRAPSSSSTLRGR